MTYNILKIYVAAWIISFAPVCTIADASADDKDGMKKVHGGDFEKE